MEIKLVCGKCHFAFDRVDKNAKAFSVLFPTSTLDAFLLFQSRNGLNRIIKTRLTALTSMNIYMTTHSVVTGDHVVSHLLS